MVAPLADVFQAEEDFAFVRVESEQTSSQPVFSGQERMDQASLGSAARNLTPADGWLRGSSLGAASFSARNGRSCVVLHDDSRSVSGSDVSSFELVGG